MRAERFWRLTADVLYRLEEFAWNRWKNARDRNRLRGEKIEGWPAHFHMRRNGRG